MGSLANSLGVASGVTVETEDGATSVASVTSIKVENGTLTDNTTSASMAFPQINGDGLASFSANLIGSWDFNDASGNLVDGTGANDFVLQAGSPTYSLASLRGTSIAPSSTSWWLNTGITPPNGAQDFTINFWEFCTNASAGGNLWSFTLDATTDTNQVNLWISGNDSRSYVNASVLSINGDPHNYAVNNVWQMVTMMRESGVFKIYIDGILDGSSMTDGTKDYSTYDMAIARAKTVYGNNFDFSDMRYYDAALSLAAIRELFNIRKGLMVGDTPATRPTATELDLVSDKLFAAWGCTDNSPITDSCVAGFDLPKIAGTPSNTTGKNGNCLSFDTTTSYTIADDVKSFCKDFGGAVGDDFSLSFWLNVSSFAAFRGIIGWATSPTSSTVAKGIGINSTTGQLRFVGNSSVMLIGGSNLSTSTWHHIALVFDTSGTPTWRLYLDGATEGSTTSENTQNLSAIDFHVGRIFNNYAASSGTTLIDEITLWKTALNSGAVSELYNSGTGRFVS